MLWRQEVPVPKGHISVMSLSRGLREPCSSSILQARGGASRRLDDARSELIGTLLRDGKIVSRPKAKEQRRSRWTRRGWAGGARTLFVPKVQVLPTRV